MDPITSAIVAALPALAGEVVSSSLKDAYAGLKALIVRKFGVTSGVAKSVNDLEANPKSKAQADLLAERVAEAKAAADAELMAAVNKLAEELAKAKVAPGNVHIEATMSGGVAGVTVLLNASADSASVSA